jgi:hypothetical protein
MQTSFSEKQVTLHGLRLQRSCNFHVSSFLKYSFKNIFVLSSSGLFSLWNDLPGFYHKQCYSASGDFFSNGATVASGLGRPHYRGFTITLRHTTLGRPPLDEGSVCRRDHYLNNKTQHSQDTDIHTPGGIRTRNHSNRGAADPHLRPCRHWRRRQWQ